MKAILGKKMGMTQIFDEEGNVIPVTVIEAGPEVVTQSQKADDRTFRKSRRCSEEASC